MGGSVHVPYTIIKNLIRLSRNARRAALVSFTFVMKCFSHSYAAVLKKDNLNSSKS